MFVHVRCVDACMQGWDSYSNFRSHNLNMEFTFECKQRARDATPPPSPPSPPSPRCPTCVFYANTIRWLDSVKNCFTHVGRPIRRGKLFGPHRAKKKKFMRHLRYVAGSVSGSIGRHVRVYA